MDDAGTDDAGTDDSGTDDSGTDEGRLHREAPFIVQRGQGRPNGGSSFSGAPASPVSGPGPGVVELPGSSVGTCTGPPVSGCSPPGAGSSVCGSPCWVGPPWGSGS